ncbi:MAG: hypothetical protein J0M11_11660, partial [Anaerolineae bacterium]|nr:hypothetical protein [Anaerolineae bacterium]
MNTDQEIEADNSLCSLYEAAIAANTDSAYKGCPAGSGADVITFADDYTITLLVTELQILSPITITGRGITNTIIQASDCNPITTPGGCSPAYNRVFYIINNDVTINDLTIQHGNCDSGCIGVNNIGGGIYNAGGNLTINNVLLNANKADYGGGLYTSGSFNTVALNNVTITGNDASNGDGRGGGAHLSANTTFANVTITNNTAKYGGGIYFYQSYTYNMLQTTMIGNSASMAGGGIYNNSAAPNITNSTISGNDANYMLGGGGIYNDGGSPTLTNVTISGNSAQNSYGGGIYNNNSDPILTNVTFSNNLAGTNGGGGMLNTNGSNPTLYNTLIANSIGGGDCVNNSTTLSPSNNNLIEDASNACGLTNGANGNIIGQDPNLGALLNNGGNTLTHALQVGSPAIDAGDDNTCETVDQRGVARPQGGHCDIGAFEYQDLANPLITSITRVGTSPISAASVDFTISFSESVQNVDVNDFSLTTTGVSGASITGVTPVFASVYTVSVNTGSGDGTIRLDMPDTASIKDLSNNNLTGLPFTTGETYTVTKPASTDVTIGGVNQGSYALAPGASQRVNYPTLDAGPVKIESTNGVPIIAALREAWNNQQTGLLSSTSFAQLMGIPAEQLSDTYYLPHYNDLSPLLDAQLRIGNVDTTTATVA